MFLPLYFSTTSNTFSHILIDIEAREQEISTCNFEITSNILYLYVNVSIIVLILGKFWFRE